jgi:hypothetical protein
MLADQDQAARRGPFHRVLHGLRVVTLLHRVSIRGASHQDCGDAAPRTRTPMLSNAPKSEEALKYQLASLKIKNSDYKCPALTRNNL